MRSSKSPSSRHRRSTQTQSKKSASSLASPSSPTLSHKSHRNGTSFAQGFANYATTHIHHNSASSRPFSTSPDQSTTPQPPTEQPSPTANPMAEKKYNLFRTVKRPLETRVKPASKRVVITGMGVVSPLGCDVEDMFTKMVNGVTAIQEIQREDLTKLNLQTRSYAPVGPLEVTDEAIIPRHLRQILSRHQMYAIVATHHALKQAQLLGRYKSAAPESAADTPANAASGQAQAETTNATTNDTTTAPAVCASGHDELCGLCEGEPACVYIRDESDRFGVCIGSSIGCVEEIGAAHSKVQEKGGKGAGAYSLPKLLVNLAAGHITQLHNARALTHTVSTACATGAHAIGDAFNFIRSNKADVIIAGGTESGVSQLSLSLFNRIHALSRQNPSTSGGPFTENRDGFVMGEGAAMVIVESLESAQKRGANILCEVLGYGISSDAYHMTQPHRLGRGAYMAMENALDDAGIDMNFVDYVNAHATSTPIGDVAESHAIRALTQNHYQRFLDQTEKEKQDKDGTAKPQTPNAAPKTPTTSSQPVDNRLFSRPFVSSTKGHVGHLLGAAGALEAVISIMAIDKNRTPPTLLRGGQISPNLPINIISFESQFLGNAVAEQGDQASNPALNPPLVSRWEELYQAQSEEAMTNPKPLKDLEDGVDYYMNERGLLCFTEKYHLDKGYCCENACKHCPYGFNPEQRQLQKDLGLEKGEIDFTQSIDVALSNSFGFGGANASLVFGRFVQ